MVLFFGVHVKRKPLFLKGVYKSIHIYRHIGRFWLQEPAYPRGDKAFNMAGLTLFPVQHRFKFLTGSNVKSSLGAKRTNTFGPGLFFQPGR